MGMILRNNKSLVVQKHLRYKVGIGYRIWRTFFRGIVRLFNFVVTIVKPMASFLVSRIDDHTPFEWSIMTTCARTVEILISRLAIPAARGIMY